MRFFIPGIEDPGDAETSYEATRKFNAEHMNANLDARRFYRVSGYHNGKPFAATVGEPFERLREIVLVILFDTGRKCYFICTASRGVLRNVPYLSGADEIHDVEFFQ